MILGSAENEDRHDTQKQDLEIVSGDAGDTGAGRHLPGAPAGPKLRLHGQSRLPGQPLTEL